MHHLLLITQLLIFKTMSWLFTSESVSEGHPDKVADQISDALLDEFLRQDLDSRVAVETMVTTGLVIVAGEVTTNGYVDVQQTVRETIANIGYTKSAYQFESNSCGVLSAIHEQSPDIHQGVIRALPEEQGAGDQGMMFGYACRETDSYMPISIDLSHKLLQELAEIRREGQLMTYLRPDAKSQVTIEYNDDRSLKRIHTIVISTQHDEGPSAANNCEQIRKDVINILIPRVIKTVNGQMSELLKLFLQELTGNVGQPAAILHVNPTGKFVIGGPHGDSGVTGRKIVVDTYGGKAPHGGGAFSGKDPSKVDRSASYATRHIAKNLVAAGVADEVLVQVSYAIGVAEPVSVFVDTFGSCKVTKGSQPGANKLTDSEIAEKIKELFDLRPYYIIERLGLKNPIYKPTASYGHFGREPYKKVVTMGGNNCSPAYEKEVEYFTWEKLDYVDRVKQAFGIA